MDNELIKMAVLWGARAAEQIWKAGGYPEGVLKKFSEETLNILVRNGLQLEYDKENAYPN